jgi:hypothetical protein
MSNHLSRNKLRLLLEQARRTHERMIEWAGTLRRGTSFSERQCAEMAEVVSLVEQLLEERDGE